MTEVKNTSVDLLSRQMTGTRKKDEKAVDGFSDFKTMLKGSNQKKDSKSPGSKEDAEDAMVSSEAAANLAAAGMTEAQASDNEFLKTGEELMTGGVEAVGTEAVPVTVPGEERNIRAMDSFRALDQFRLQKLAENSVGMESLKEEIQILQQEELTEVPQALFAEQNNPFEIAGEKEATVWSSSIQDSEIMGSAKLDKEVFRNELLTETAEEVLYFAEKEQTPVLQGGDVEEKKSSEEENQNHALAGLGERPYQPAGSQVHRSEKIEEIPVSVNADNSEELEAKLSEQILRQIRGGKGELDIQLDPHNLGKIRIKISYEDNQISVSLMCTENKTLKLLSQAASDLGAILESNLERSFQIQVDKQETDYLNQQQDQNQRQEQREQHQGRQQEGNPEDFIQKLRLGIFKMSDISEDGTGYR